MRPEMIFRTLFAASATPSITPSDIAPGAEHPRQEQRHQRIDHFARGVGEEAHPPEQPDRTRDRHGSVPGQYNRRLPSRPFDAVLLIAFGGPHGPADVRPFLGNVLRGRRVAPERVEEVAHHYELFGGVSPITELTGRRPTARATGCAAAALPCRSTSGCATGIRSSPTRSPRCHAPASAAPSG